MNKINGYDVVITKGTPRFRLNNKLIARSTVPLDIQNQLIEAVMDKEKVRTVGAAPDLAATFTTEQPTQLPLELDFTEEDGEKPGNVSSIEGEPLFGEDPGDVVELDRSPNSGFSNLELQLIEENEQLKRTMSELAPAPAQSQLTASDYGKILLDSFGIYTALAPRDPQIGDVHPFTLRPMNRYDVGLAYTERKKSNGVDENTLGPAQVSVPQENPQNNGGFPSFAERTGVSFGAQTSATLKSHNNDPINDEATAEPNLRGTTIRPYW